MAQQVLIVFGSQYGYTEKYAGWIADRLHDSAEPLETKLVAASQLTASDIAEAQAVVIGASDYGGFLTGAGDVTKLAAELSQKPKVFFSVSFSGLDGMPTEKLDAIITKNFGEVAADSPMFHFRGGLDHQRLSLKHKTVMMGIRAGIAAIPNKNEANRQMLESFDQGTVDYSDPEAVTPLVQAVLQQLQA